MTDEPARFHSTADDDELLGAVRQLARESVPAVAPPAELWARIAAAADTEDRGLQGEELLPASAALPDPEPLAEVVPLRRRRLPVITAAAAAVVVVAIGVGVLVTGTSGNSTETVAASELADLASSQNVGAATLVADGDDLVLRVEAMAEPADGEFLELWLIDEAVTEPISLGRYDGAGDYAVPEGINPAAFPIVDISSEPDDGDAAHSGASVVRGVLDL
ncbi:MAG: anti-sigma factor [Actinomycetota bacterium]